MTTAVGWPPGAIEDPHLDFEPNAFDRADVAADRDARIQLNRRRHRAAAGGADRGEAFDPAEFAEFLEADDSPMPANPAFKERLRRQLWGTLREHAHATAPPALPRIGDPARRPRPGPNPKLAR